MNSVRRNIVSITLILLMHFLSISSSIAQEFSGEDIFLDSIPVSFSTLRMDQHATDSSNAISIIDRHTIRASGAVHIADLFRLVPGFQVAWFQNNTPVVTSHGFVGNYERRIQVMVDGRSVYIPLLSTVDWNSLGIDIGDIEKIEVIRGPNISAYGSNSFSAAINIITRRSYLTEKTTISILGGTSNFDTAREGNGIPNPEYADVRQADFSHSGRFENMSYRLSGGYKENDGFLGIDDSTRLGRLLLRSEYNPASDVVYDVQAGLVYGELGVFADPNSRAFDVPRNKTLSSHFQKVTMVKHLGSDKISLQAYHNWYSQKDRKTLGTINEVLNYHFSLPENQSDKDALLLAFGTTNFDTVLGLIYGSDLDREIDISLNDGDAQRFDVESLYKSYYLKHGLRFVSGAGWRLDRIRSDAIIARDDFVSEMSVRAFSSLEWKFVERLTINSGLMIEGESLSKFRWSPNLGLNIQFSRVHHLRSNASLAYREPSLLEKNIRYGLQFTDSRELGDHQAFAAENIEPEKILSYELGYLGDFRKYDVLIDLRAFREEIRDGIFAIEDRNYEGDPYSLDGKIWYWDNVTDVNIQGVEAQFTYKPDPVTLFVTQYAFLRCESCTYLRHLNKPQQAGDVEDISNTVPLHTASLLAQRSLVKNTSISVAYYYLSGMKWMENGHNINAYDRWDLNFHYSYNRKGFSTDVRLSLQNIFDAYKEFRVYNEMETRAFLMLSTSF